jgi:chitinase
MLTLSSLLLALPLLASSVSANAVAEATEIGARTNKPSTPKVALAWYGGWHAEDYPLSKVSWNKYTHMTYSFAETTPDVHNLSLANSDQELLPQFVKIAKKNVRTCYLT